MVQKRTEILHALEEGHGNTAWIGNLVAGQIVKEHVEEMRGSALTTICWCGRAAF